MDNVDFKLCQSILEDTPDLTYEVERVFKSFIAEHPDMDEPELMNYTRAFREYLS